MKPTKYELDFYNRAIDEILVLDLSTIDKGKDILSTYEIFFDKNPRYERLKSLYNERVNFVTPNPSIKRVKELTQQEWEDKMKDSSFDQLEWEDNN